MDYRSPLQHLLHNLLPSRSQAGTAAAAPGFVDTQPVGDRARAAPAARRPVPLQRRPNLWAESALDLAKGTEITEFPDDAAADLMDEFFDKEKRAA